MAEETRYIATQEVESSVRDLKATGQRKSQRLFVNVTKAELDLGHVIRLICSTFLRVCYVANDSFVSFFHM